MASFTDQVPTFNPYVSQQPVDAMVQVGMAKQQQYDTNLQKIQQTMSSIAGLQIGREVDKQYLETKMGEMNKQLGLYASSDLSSNKLTTHLRSMVGGIAQDEVVQNSVRSTMAAQSAKQLQGKYNEAGKGSPSNDWLLNSQLQEWYNNPEAGASFSGTYTPYTDYKKNSLNVIKELTGDSTLTEDAYSFDKNGKLVIHDAITRQKIEALSPEKVQTALMAGLSAADWNQIQIDGRYQYAGIGDPEQFGQIMEGNHNMKIKKLQGTINEIKKARDITNDMTKINQYDAQIKQINNSIETSNSKHKEKVSKLDANTLEGYKAQMFTENYLDNIGSAFSYKKQETTFESNPYAERQFARDRAAVTDKKWQISHDWDKEKYGYDYSQKERFHADKMAADKAKADAKGPQPGGNREEFTIPKEFLPDANMVNLQGIVKGYNDEKASIVSSTGLSDEEFQDKYKTFLAGNKSSNEIDPIYHDALFQYDNVERKAKMYDDARIQLDAEADARFPTLEDFVPEADKNARYKYSEEGEPSADIGNKDIINYINNRDIYRKKYGYTNVNHKSGTVNRRVDAERAKQELSPEQYHLLVADNIPKSLGYGGDNTFHGQISKVIERYDDDVFDNQEYKSMMRDKTKFINDELGKRLPVPNAVQFDMSFDKADDRKQYFTQVSASINNILDTVGGLPFAKEIMGEKLTKENFQNFIGKTGGLVPTIKYGYWGGDGLVPDRSYYALMTNAAGETKRIPLPESLVDRYDIAQFEETPTDNFVNEAMDAIRLKTGTNIGSTAGKGGSTFNDATYNNLYFPKVGVYNVSADLHHIGNNRFNIRLNVVDPVTGEIKQDLAYPKGTVPGSDVQALMQSIDDSRIFSLIRQTEPSKAIKSVDDLRAELQKLTQDE